MHRIPRIGRRAAVFAITGVLAFGFAGTALADHERHSTHHHTSDCGHDYDDGHYDDNYGYYDDDGYGYGHGYDDADGIYERRRAARLRAQRLVRLIDDNRDGYITFREARAWGFARSFRYADQNRDGYVTERELVRFDLGYGIADAHAVKRPYRGAYRGYDRTYQQPRSYRDSRRSTYVRVRDHRGRTYYRRR